MFFIRVFVFYIVTSKTINLPKWWIERKKALQNLPIAPLSLLYCQSSQIRSHFNENNDIISNRITQLKEKSVILVRAESEGA